MEDHLQKRLLIFLALPALTTPTLLSGCGGDGGGGLPAASDFAVTDFVARGG
jgi:hypothetical protein